MLLDVRLKFLASFTILGLGVCLAAVIANAFLKFDLC